jgi:hypothetical protein
VCDLITQQHAHVCDLITQQHARVCDLITQQHSHVCDLITQQHAHVCDLITQQHAHVCDLITQQHARVCDLITQQHAHVASCARGHVTRTFHSGRIPSSKYKMVEISDMTTAMTSKLMTSCVCTICICIHMYHIVHTYMTKHTRTRIRTHAHVYYDRMIVTRTCKFMCHLYSVPRNSYAVHIYYKTMHCMCRTVCMNVYMYIDMPMHACMQA